MLMTTSKTEILVDGAAFWERLQHDILNAQHSVCIQTLSLEGDATGRALADALIACRAPDRRVLVDSFNLYFQSDRFVYAPGNLRNGAVQSEVRATRAMIAELRRNGVQVKYTNPAGALLYRLAARDHKKLALIDGGIAYLGGINFCDHNFAWHDMMLRLVRADVARALTTDFHATWDGVLAPAVTHCRDIELLNLDGARNESTCRRVLDCIGEARETIYVLSPYMTFPFTDALRAAARRGVRVVVLTPAENNRGFLKTYMSAECTRSSFELRLYPGRMSHLKAMLIDDERLVVGSSNFDWLTSHLLGEIIAITSDVDTIGQFRTRVLQPDLERSISAPAAPAWHAVVLDRLMRGVAAVAGMLCKPAVRHAGRHAVFIPTIQESSCAIAA